MEPKENDFVKIDVVSGNIYEGVYKKFLSRLYNSSAIVLEVGDNNVIIPVDKIAAIEIIS